MNEKWIKKYKIKKFYKYAQAKEGNKIEFGWMPSKDVDEPAIISYPSKSSKVLPEEKAWSEEEGSNATSVEDYKKWISSLVGISAESILESWQTEEDFTEWWTQQLEEINSSHRVSGDIIYKLANLIVNGDKFTIRGRIFKVIDASL